MTQRESKLSRRINEQLSQRGAFVFKVHGSEHMMAGLPDLIVCYRGYYIGMEVKHPETRKNVSRIQEYVHKKIESAGGQAWVVCSPAEALRVIDRIDSLIGEIADDSSSIDSPDPSAQGRKRIALKSSRDDRSTRRIKRRELHPGD